MTTILWDDEKSKVEATYVQTSCDTVLINSLIINMNWRPSDLNLLEDIYVFDESFKWLIVFTHEYVDQTDTNAHRICFSNLLI